VGAPTYAYTRNPAYYSVSSDMSSLRSSMIANEYVVGSTVESWDYDFQQWATSTGVSISTEADYYTQLNTYLGGSGSQFRRHVVFTDNTASGSASNPITIARIECNHMWTKDSSISVKQMDSFRSTVNAYDTSLAGTSGEPFGYSSLYPVYEGYKVVKDEFHRNLALALAAVTVVILLLIPNPAVSLLVILTIGATVVEVCGYIHWWGAQLDSVTIVMTIVSLGIAVDYASHIGHSFHCNFGTAEERATAALINMGTCVWHGFVSTFLAIVVLASSKSYVFQSFFKALFLASILAIFHGMVVLPVLLKLFGGDRLRSDDTSDDALSDTHSNQLQVHSKDDDHTQDKQL